MKITVNKAPSGVYALGFDDTEISLAETELKELLVKVAGVLAPGGEAPPDAEQRARDFMRHIKSANDVGIQTFLRVADQGDLLVLLKTAESDNDTALLDKFHGNMSERSRKMYDEDMAYKFNEGVPGDQVVNAIGRLIGIARELEEKGTLVFENVADRMAARDLAEGR